MTLSRHVGPDCLGLLPEVVHTFDRERGAWVAIPTGGRRPCPTCSPVYDYLGVPRERGEKSTGLF